MRWPWQSKPEERSTAQGYTASLTAALEAGASVGVADTAPLATAALEIAAGLYARCMAAATVTGAPDAARALTPPVLALIARNLIRRGEDHHRIYVRGGRLVLAPVGFAYAHGAGPDPLSWIYSATMYGPTDSRHETVPAASMLHCRNSVDSSRPLARRAALVVGSVHELGDSGARASGRGGGVGALRSSTRSAGISADR